MTEERDNGVILGHHECPDCGSNDNLVVYEKPDGSVDGYCYSPNCISPSGKVGFKSNNELYKTYLKDEYDIRRIDRSKKKVAEDDKPARKRTTKVAKEKKAITPEEKASVHKQSSIKGGGYRNVLDKYNKKLGIRTSFSDSGGVEYRWYPVTEGKTEEGKPNLVGYKKRICATKDFRYVGKGSGDVDLFNQWNCSGNGKRLVLVGGEEDTLAAVQMIEEYRKTSKNAAPVDVVSSSIGEGSIDKQCQLNYDFLDGYESIIISLDADTAGENATEKLIKVLPPSKVKVMQQPSGSKDPSDALQNGDEEQWVRLLYAATKPKIAGIVSSLDVHQRLLDICDIPVIPLPPFMKKANNMLCGGLPRGEIVNILAGSGIGKTTMVNEFVYFWIRNSPAKVGILSMEAGSGKYWEKLLSRHLGENIGRMGDVDEDGNYLPTRDTKREYLSSPEVLEAVDNLASKDGEETFSLIDERGDLETIQSVKQMITRLIVGCGCSIIVVDPVQDVLDSLPIEVQAEFCGWLKKMKSKGTTFILINHSRKGAGGTKSASRGAELDEQDMQGTSALFKSGAVNIILNRDKEHEDAEERNTTTVRISKNRDAAETGGAGGIYYEFKTHILHDKYVWSESQIEGY